MVPTRKSPNGSKASSVKGSPGGAGTKRSTGKNTSTPQSKKSKTSENADQGNKDRQSLASKGTRNSKLQKDNNARAGPIQRKPVSDNCSI